MYDLHVHTSNVSGCGRVPGKGVVQQYSQIGYQGVVITDHYFEGYFYGLGDMFWKDKVKKYLSGYVEAQNFGLRVGVDVFLGIEIQFHNDPNDYLVYGITPEFLVKYPKLYDLGLEEFRLLATENNLLIYQAHPFRSYNSPAKAKLLDGVEVHNGNPRHCSNNHKALDFAKQHQLRMISGSDFHQPEDLGRGGVVFKEKIKSNLHLVDLLRCEEIVKLKKTNN